MISGVCGKAYHAKGMALVEIEFHRFGRSMTQSADRSGIIDSDID